MATICIVGSSGLGKSTLAISLVDKVSSFNRRSCTIKDNTVHFYSSWIKIDETKK